METALSIRCLLHKQFPGCRFIVGSDGRDVRVNWENGPTENQVVKAVNPNGQSGISCVRRFANETALFDRIARDLCIGRGVVPYPGLNARVLGSALTLREEVYQLLLVTSFYPDLEYGGIAATGDEIVTVGTVAVE